VSTEDYSRTSGSLLVMGGMVAIAGVFAAVYLWWSHVTGASPVTAAEAGDLAALESMRASGADLNYRDPRKFRWTPLIAAIHARNTNAICYLLTNGVDVNLPDADGRTALIWALLELDSDTNVIVGLIEHGADAIATDKSGLSANSFEAFSNLQKMALQISTRAASATNNNR
jgi:ankyrin repeat protein